jgi:hypothetical protein
MSFIGASLAAAAGRSRRVYLESASFGDFDIAPGSAQTSAQITSAGAVNEVDTGTTLKFTWLLRGSGSDYDVRATHSGDAVTGSATGSWISLGSSVQWFLSQSGAGVASCDLLIEIRHATSGAVIDSANFSMTATVSGA